MPKCSLNCNRGCGRDHGSKAIQSPSIVDIEVVQKILTQAALNTYKRLIEFSEGSMSEEELQGKSIILADWLKETFCGRNRHFENGAEDWNPVGLAEFILSVAPEIAAVDQIRTEEDAAKVIEEACSLFVQQISTASKIAFDSGIQIKNFNELTPPIRTLIETWSLLLVGAPECMP